MKNHLVIFGRIDRHTHEPMEDKKNIKKLNIEFKKTRRKNLKELCFWLFVKSFSNKNK